MNRRKFFKKSVFSAIGTAGLLKTAQAAESAKSTDNNVQEYDIVVIGSGCAGLTVAIEAASCFLKGLLAHAGMAGGLKSTSP